MLYKVLRFIEKPILKLYFRLQVDGRENIPKEGAYIIVANHTSYIDPFLICGIIPRIIHYFTLALFYYHPLLHWICKRIYCIPVKKDEYEISALKKALRLLEDGKLIGIFPEGTRSETGKLGRGESGVGLIALKAKVPILPVGIRGAYESFPRKSKFPKPCQITVIFGKSFRLGEYMDVDIHKIRELRQEATDLIMSKIAEVCSLEPV